MQAKSTDQEPIALYLRQFGSYEIRSKNKLGLIDVLQNRALGS